MSPKIFIPCTVTLTEKEYSAVLRLAKTLAPSDYAFSAAVRQIICEWSSLQAFDGKSSKAVSSAETAGGTQQSD